MGLFSAIGKVFKKVISGVKKVFKPVVKAVSKLTQKKWFRTLLIAGAVFTAGVALYAGVTAGMAASASGASLMSSVVTGAQSFMSALLSPISTAKAAFAGELSVASRTAQMAATAGTGAANAAASAAGNMVTAGEGVTTAGATGPGLTTPVGTTAPYVSGEAVGAVAPAAESMSIAGGAPAPGMSAASVDPVTGKLNFSNPGPAALANLPEPPPSSGGWLSKGAAALGDFAKSSGGGMLLAGAMQGFGQGKLAEAELEEKHRIEGLWNDPEQVAAILAATQRPVAASTGNVNGQSNVAMPWQIRNQYGYPPTVNYRGG